MRRLLTALLLCAGCALCTAGAVPDTAALDRRVQRVTEELRCLVCQNQTIADSHAELALMLKKQVRTMLEQGKSDQEAIDFMVQRYGDFVLYRPPVKGTTWLLWFGPFLLLAGALALVLGWLRRQSRGAGAGDQADDEADDETGFETGEVTP